MACYDEDFSNSHHPDFDKEQIRAQLQLLGASFCVVITEGAMNIFHVKEYFLSFSQRQPLLISQVVALLRFILVIPATNAILEKSFSALQHLKSRAGLRPSDAWGTAQLPPWKTLLKNESHNTPPPPMFTYLDCE